MPKRPQQTLTVEQEISLLAALDAGHPRIATAARLMVTLGLRLGEARQVRWNWLRDLDSSTPLLDVPDDATKTRWPRTLPIPAPFQGYLIALRERQHLSKPLNFPGDWPLVLNRWGAPPSTRYIQRTISNASQTILGIKIRSHTLRHTFATRLLSHTNLRVVQMALGHKSITSTEIYTHPQLDDLRAAINAAASEPKKENSHV